MLANAAVRNLIRDGKSFQLPNVIRMNSNNGMELLDQALVRLYRAEIITKERVYDFCNDPEEIAKLCGEKIPKKQDEFDMALNTQFT
jgi:twitching motility protein PilT